MNFRHAVIERSTRRHTLAASLPLAALLTGCADLRRADAPGSESATAAASGAASDATATRSGALTAQHRLTFRLPEHANPADFAIVANESADLADRARLVTPAGGFARLSAAGTPTTTLGVEAHSGHVIARGKVFLREKAHVHGNVTTGSILEKQSQWTIDGTLTQNATINYKPFEIVSSYPDARRNAINLEPNQTLATPIEPAYYAGLAVKRDATVTLRAGTYFFDSFQIEPNGRIRLDDSTGPITVHVRQTFDFKGILQRTQAGHPQLLVAFAGTSSVFLGATFRGTVLAPNAEINLATVGPAGHEGAFFGKTVRVAADVKVVHRPFSWIIGKVSVDKPTPCKGETVTVAVDATNPFDATKPPAVTINTAPGTRRLIQLPPSYTGRRAIFVSAAAGSVSESQLVFVDVQACPGTPERPDIFTEMNHFQDGVVEFGIVNSNTFAAAGTIYHWEFGDGTSEDTSFPAVTHSYANAQVRDREFNSFDVRVAVRRPNQAEIAASSTVTLWNAYAYSKARGHIRPPATTASDKLTAAGAGTVTLRNLEDETIRFTNRRIDLQRCDPNAAPQYGALDAIDVSIAAASSGSSSFTVPPGNLTGVCSVGVHLIGTTASSRPVTADAYFLVPGGQAGTLNAVAKSILNYIAINNLLPGAASVSDDDVQRLARQGRIPIEVLTGETMIPPPTPVMTLQGPPPGDPLGTPCSPGQAPPRPGLTCQLHEWSKEAVPQIANALRGDVILSRSCGFIGGLLAKVSPPQKWSHTGIMTENYVRIRQSTGLDAYMQDHPNGDFDMPTDGFEEHALRYLWPGTLESEVRQAYETGIELTDPDGKVRTVKGFNHRAIRCDEDKVLVFPHVLKPSAAREQEIRPLLHQLADASLQVNGHYRFFSYSDASAVNNPSPPSWVASNPTQTVCSSLLWRSAQLAGLTLDADKTNNNNEVVVPTTLDGLFFYRQDERRDAANFLYKTLYNQVDQAVGQGAVDLGNKLDSAVEGGFGSLLAQGIGRGLAEGLSWTSDIRDDVASQVVNCFASDYCSESAKDSERWKDPGDGMAVSPDDLLSWDLFDQHSEPLVYRTGQSVPVFQWKASAGTATVCGRVLLDGNPVEGAQVLLTENPFPDVSAADGTFGFPGTSIGTHALTASLFVGDEMTGELLTKTVDITVAADPNPCVDIALERPSLDFRRVLLDGQLYVFDEGDEDRSVVGATELFVGLNQPPESRMLMQTCAGDESRVEVRVTATYVGQGAVRIDVDQDLYEGSCFLCSACDNNDHDGSSETAFLVCDASTPEADCTALALQQGLSTSAVNEFTLLNFRVDNESENTGEFGRSTIKVTNRRQ